MKTFSTIHDLRRALSDHMESQRLTQQDVAKATGTTQSAISLFLRGKRGLNGDAVLKIQSFLIAESTGQACDVIAPLARAEE